MELKILATVFVSVFVAELGGEQVNPSVLNYAAGTGFIAIGIWTLVRA
jgi:putative Ca2+/H+ antiporter (TMEM165/GDT1 family)